MRKFEGYRQQDSHELLRHLLDEMKTEEIMVGGVCCYGDGLLLVTWSSLLVHCFFHRESGEE